MPEEQNISLKDLQPGDLIFTFLPTVEGEPEDVGHVMIYAPEAGKKADIAHAIIGTESLVKKTSLPEGKYVIYRPQSSDLAAEAARIATNWSDYAVPYDEERKIESEKIESAMILRGRDFEEGIQNAVLDSHQRFEEEVKFRAIKYAARR